MTAVPAMTSCSAWRRFPQQDAREPQSQEQEAQRERRIRATAWRRAVTRR